MGCISSKHDRVYYTLPSGNAGREAWLLQYPSKDITPDSAAVRQYPVNRSHQAAASSTEAVHYTTIRDLPPDLLANILSRQDNWLELFRSIPLVCKSWHQLLQHATPEDVSLELDTPLVPQAMHKPAHAVLPGLQRLHSWRLQRWRQQQQQQQQQVQFPAAPAAQVGEHAPWVCWLAQHGDQLKHFSVSINATGVSCNEDIFKLKELVLQLLAADRSSSTIVDTAVKHVVNNNSSSSGRSISDEIGAKRATDDCAGSEGDIISKDADNSYDAYCSSSTPTDAHCTILDSCSSGSSNMSCSDLAACSTGQLQLRSLQLRLPLFEHDVQLITSGICKRAPRLRSLALIGYTPTGCSGSSSSSRSTATPPVPAQLPAQQQQQGPAMQPAGQQQQQQQQQPPPNNGTTANSHNSSVDDQKSPNQQIIRQGFITGASLQQLLAAATNLQSLTFACRQLYKTSWLAPATSLTHLSLRNCRLTHHSVSELVTLKLPQLVNLDLSVNPELGRVQQQQHGRCNMSSGSSSSGPSSLALVARLTRLRCLNISGWDFADVSRHSLSSSSSSSDVPGSVFSQLTALTRLVELKMESCALVHWSLGPDSQAGNMLPHLTYLSLSHNPLSCDSVAAVCQLTQLKRLGLAGVAGRGTVSAAAAAAATMAAQQAHPAPQPRTASSSLHTISMMLGLHVSSCWTSLQGMPALTALQLSNNWFAEREVAVFTNCVCTAVAHMPSLSKVDLGGCKFPHKMLQELLRSLPASVNDVILDGSVKVTSGDLRLLGSLPKLRLLAVSHMVPGFRDKHAEVLAGLRGLRVLRLAGNNVGPRGLAALKRGLPHLRELDVTDNPHLAKVRKG